MLRPLLNQLRKVNKIYFLENFLAKRTRGKRLSNFWTKLLPPLSSYRKGSIRIVERNEIKYELDISDYVQYVIYYGLDVEPKKNLYGSIKDGMNVFDVGTNMGETLLNFSKLNPGGKNFGFEPVPFLYEQAKRNIALNGFKNIYLNNLALSDSPAILYFELPPNRNFGSISMSQHKTSDSTQVIAMTFDEFINKENIRKVDFIKVDVEGFEQKVLQGAFNTIKMYRPILFVELIDDYLKQKGSSAAQLVKWIADLGYRIYDADDNTPVNPGSSFEKMHIDILCIPS